MDGRLTVAEYMAACEETLNETLMTVREMVDEAGPEATAILLRAIYTKWAIVDPSRCAGILAHALIRLVTKRGAGDAH